MSVTKRALFIGFTAIAIFALVRSRASKVEYQSDDSTAVETSKPNNLFRLKAVAPFHSQAPTLSKAAPATALKSKNGTPIQIAQPTVAEQERQSVETLTSILSEATTNASSPANLVSLLIRAGYEPIASRDADPVTGSMIVIETKNALPGSRYFRAQYFSDEEGNYTPQHISFELRPGTPKALVTAALSKAFGGALPSPSYKDAEWTSYKMHDGYTLWTKILNSEDVKENAISAHDANDVGTIQVAIEKELPGHEDEF